jgi:hypothetical protein
MWKQSLYIFWSVYGITFKHTFLRKQVNSGLCDRRWNGSMCHPALMECKVWYPTFKHNITHTHINNVQVTNNVHGSMFLGTRGSNFFLNSDCLSERRRSVTSLCYLMTKLGSKISPLPLENYSLCSVFHEIILNAALKSVVAAHI